MIELRDELVLIRTEAGDAAARRPRRIASSRDRAALLLLDGALTIGELKRRFGDSLEIESAMAKLLADGLVVDRDASAAGRVSAQRQPRSATVPAAALETGRDDGVRAPPPDEPAGPITVTGSARADERIEPGLRADVEFPNEDLPPPTESAAPIPKALPEPSRLILVADRARYHLVRAMRGLGYLFLAISAVGLIAMAFKVPEWYREEIEFQARKVGGSAVQIESLGIGWQRGPVLLLEGVRFTDDDSIRVESVGVAPDWYGVTWKGRLSSRLTVQGLRGRPSALGRLLARLDLAPLATDRVILVGLRVVLAEGIAPVLEGEAEVSGGRIGPLTLRDESGLVRIEVSDPAQTPLKLSIAAANWAAPMLDKLRFEQLRMGGELRDDQLQIIDMRAAAHGGRYSAEGTLRWNPSPKFDGTLWLDGVQFDRLLLAVMPEANAEGSISGRFKLVSAAPTLAELAASTRLEGNFRIARGSLGSADLGGVMRERGGGLVQGGQTRFETIHGRLQASGGQARVDIRSLDAGGLVATGSLVFPTDGSISGRVRGSVQAGERRLSMPIKVSGSVGSPALRLEPEAPPAAPEVLAEPYGQ